MSNFEIYAAIPGVYPICRFARWDLSLEVCTTLPLFIKFNEIISSQDMSNIVIKAAIPGV